jgi:hypothetical protein
MEHMTSKDILRRHRAQRDGIVVRLYAPTTYPTVHPLPDGAFAPATFRTHLHIGTRYMRAV